MKINYILLIAFSVLLFSCDQQAKETKPQQKEEYKPIEITPEQVINISLDDSTKKALLQQGKTMAAEMQNTFQVKMRKAIKEGGMLHAIEYCNESAMQISDSVSYAKQAIIKRLATKNRNPNNRMNDQEKRIYKDFVLAWISNTPMRPRIQINAQHKPVYYAPITMRPICLNCHGNVEKDINPDVASKIKELYPNDKAIDFKAVDMRGMWKITFPGYYINQ
ncbi:MAG: DUF3365 domain-containing protein [Chlorobi bacterium]|nr:DUF3365 domain-containing protein [Chlorobiota bacterium]